MLNILRQIVQEVNDVQDLQAVLSLVVRKISENMSVEACSIYLADTNTQQFLLAASIGFDEAIDGRVTFSFSEGLVGWVGEYQKPLNLSHANQHPRYHCLPEIGEAKYQAFLGVPIIHQRHLLGVLAVHQRTSRHFDESEVAFLITISAQLAGMIAQKQATSIIDQLSLSNPAIIRIIRGVAAAPGVAVGEAVVVYQKNNLDSMPDKAVEDCSVEIEYFKKALVKTKFDIECLKQRLSTTLLSEEQYLFDAYLNILDSKTLSEDIIAVIKENHWAPYALKKIIKRQVHKFEMMEDAYLRERATDLMDLGQRILAHLLSDQIYPPYYPKQTILVGNEITASMLAEVPHEHLVGVISIKGSVNAHATILARAMGVPVVLGVSGLPMHKLDGKCIIVDGYNGEIFTSPSQRMQREFSRLAEEEKTLYAGFAELRPLKAQTPDGAHIELHANAGLITDIHRAIQAGAEGIGLYRSEVSFMHRDRFLSEEEQYFIYRQLLEKFFPKPVTIRTLDIGGDKKLPYFPIDEVNPSLGWRGIRITLDHPEIFLIQLRAMLRASRGLNNLKVIFPMISCAQEVDVALALLRQAYDEVIEEDVEIVFPQTGIMIEIPAAVYQIEILIKKVDFVSIGSNDLTQYLLAVDRTNPSVAPMYDALHPAVIMAMRNVISVVHAQNKKVSLCGEIASDPVAVIILLGLGVDSLSLHAHNLPRIKWVIRNFSMSKAKQLLKEIQIYEHTKDIRDHIKSALKEAGLGVLIRAGK